MFTVWYESLHLLAPPKTSTSLPCQHIRMQKLQSEEQNAILKQWSNNVMLKLIYGFNMKSSLIQLVNNKELLRCQVFSRKICVMSVCV